MGPMGLIEQAEACTTNEKPSGVTGGCEENYSLFSFRADWWRPSGSDRIRGRHRGLR